ncbi:MAG: hypothetical protein IJW64_00425 [Clostridia bacterium]|nr:hypothetical protein [Clostridia bacterium]
MEMVLREAIPEIARYKLKVNGFHLVGTRTAIKSNKRRIKKDFISELFEIAYKESKDLNLNVEKQKEYINSRMIVLYKNNHYYEDLFDMLNNDIDFSDYVEKRLKQKRINLIMRKKRFKEKANLHCWNYFVTQTYDSSKFDNEEEFKKSYLTCLSHLATDYGWRFMGVWENGAVTGRLHFHGVFYIPKGQMKGFFKVSKYFNPMRKRMEKSMINSFFAVRFGRNDFQPIENNVGGVANYIIKYIGKTEEKIVYSRHIDSCLDVELEKDDISLGYKLSYCNKFVIYDEILKSTILDPELKRSDCDVFPLLN